MNRAASGANRDALWIALVTLIGAALRIWIATRNSGLTMDSPVYVEMAEHIRHGERAPGYQHHGYSFAIAMASFLLPGREWPGRVVSLLSGVALLPVVFLLARRRMPAPAAALAAGLVALHPILAVYSGAIMSDSLFLLLVFAGVLLVESGRGFTSGVLFGLSYVTRPEGAVIGAMSAAFARPGVRRMALWLAGAALVSAPYVVYLHWNLNQWRLTNKPIPTLPLEFGRAEREFHVGTPPPGDLPVPEPKRSPNRVTEAIADFPEQLIAYSKLLLRLWPLPLLALSAAGIWGGAWLAPLLFLFVLMLIPHPADQRFLQVALPSLGVAAGIGAVRITGWLAHVPRLARASRLAPAAAALLAVAGLGMVWKDRPGVDALHFDDGPTLEYREAAAWLRANAPRQARVMDRKVYVPFLADLGFTLMPDDPYEEIVRYAQRSGADYMVVEEFVAVVFRNQLLPLLGDDAFRERERRLRLVYATRREPMTGVAVFKVMRDSTSAPRDSGASAPR